jgi:hypothetical protein
MTKSASCDGSRSPSPSGLITHRIDNDAHIAHNVSMPSWTLLIPDYFPPSLNHVAMAHWSKVRKHKKAAIERVHIYGLAAGGLPRFVGPVAIRITRLYGKGQRRLDLDNLFGAVKPLVDALRDAKTTRNHRGTAKQGGLGIIADDDPKSMTLIVDQERNPDGDNLCTRIHITGDTDDARA